MTISVRLIYINNTKHTWVIVPTTCWMRRRWCTRRFGNHGWRHIGVSYLTATAVNFIDTTVVIAALITLLLQTGGQCINCIAHYMESWVDDEIYETWNKNHKSIGELFLLYKPHAEIKRINFLQTLSLVVWYSTVILQCKRTIYNYRGPHLCGDCAVTCWLNIRKRYLGLVGLRETGEQ